MKLLKNIIGGLAGAAALNLLHETARRLDPETPRVDLVGEEALSKGLETLGIEPLTGNALYTATLAGDLLSNAFYYSMIGAGKRKYLVARGLAYGVAAGIGALKLTEPLGLNDVPVTRTQKTQLLTIAYYAFGGLVTAWVINGLRKKV
ncbi:hypothetical protein [Mucilaginibacter panaciglaebae]